MENTRNANAPGQHPQGIPCKKHGVDSGLASTLTDKLIDLQDTITAALVATENHSGTVDELFFQSIRRDAGFLIDRIAAFGMDAAAEAAGETGGEA